MQGLTKSRHERRRRTTTAALALLLSWVLAPVVHAQFEVASASPAVEQGHTADCPRIHTDTLCLACSGIQLPAQVTADRVPRRDADLILPAAVYDRIAGPSTPVRDGHGVRAPPIS